MFTIAKLYKFVEQVRQEVSKVIWPARNELFSLTLVVLVVVLLVGLSCLMLDYVIHKVLQILLNFGI